MYQEIVSGLEVMGTFQKMIDTSQGCYDLQGTRKDRECLQSIGGKLIQVYCHQPGRSLFPIAG